ncbi:hypothetical protein [Pseudonocardia sp. NPDC049635]|uniref:hypothetical protein n=1 Tax=Pseudonocardia sp. NPDC049635 TaxID=3155506 RepID=UPI0033EA053F
MTWVKVDDALADHRKVRRLGKDRLPAMGLWVLTASWCGQQLTDGFVPAEVVERFDPRQKMATRLVDVGLWVRESDPEEGDGFRFHDWADHQPTRDEVERKRDEARVRMNRVRARRRADRANRTDPVRDDDPENVPPPVRANTPVNDDSTFSYPDPARPVVLLPENNTPPDGGVPRAARDTPAAVDNEASRQRRRAGRHTEMAKTARSGAAVRIVNAWADSCDHRPGPRVIRDLGVEVDQLLRRGWPDDLLARCVEAWASKGLGPSTFQSVASEVANRRPATPQTVTTRALAGLDDAFAEYERRHSSEVVQLPGRGA